MNSEYIFTSQRLGFRFWKTDDLDHFSEMNADPEVMQHFPKVLTLDESKEFLDRLMAHQEKHGYCYYAVELKESGEWLGFIGMAYQTFESDFTPCTDIGWRLKRSAWGHGYATEGAECCKIFAFRTLKLTKLIATCTTTNFSSENVMKKIGMTKSADFKHPNLTGFPELQDCFCYEILA